MKITKSELRQLIKEARMAEYGKQDAAQGLPPSKAGRKNKEYMDAYREEKENIKEEMSSFGMAEDVIELLGSKYNVMEEDVPTILIAMANSLKDR